MTDIVQRKIQRWKILIYSSILLAAGQSLYLEIITSDYAHIIISAYFIIEVVILLSMIIFGLKNKWTRIILVLLTICETVLFLEDGPISPDELLMILIFGIRVYVIVGLFSKTVNERL